MMKNEVKTLRRTFRFKQLVPLVLGLGFGCFISAFYIPRHDTYKCDNNHKEKTFIVKVANKPKIVQQKDKKSSSPAYVKPKSTRFNYDFRPYFVYSELGFRFQFIVAVMTTELRLNTFGVAINNTWLTGLPQVIFFTAYSKNGNFHEHYNSQLNLNVVQLTDITEESTRSEFSFRILQYLKDNFADSYSWFMLVSDEVYVQSDDMLQFLHSLNSSDDLYLGHPMKSGQSNMFSSNKKDVFQKFYCYDQSGIVLSRTTLLKFEAPTVKTHALVGEVIGQSIYQTSKVECLPEKELQKLFVVDKSRVINVNYVTRGDVSEQALVLYPVKSAMDMLEIHKHFTLEKLHGTYKKIHQLQKDIQEINVKLPTGVLEKKLHWPIGFPEPFVPLSRFEVIDWTYFDHNHLYGHTDTSPVSSYDTANKRDIVNILEVAKEALQKQDGPAKEYNFKLKNGYRRLDPQRGAEYVIDMIKTQGTTKKQQLKRVYLVKPFSKIEALQMPAATEQKGIHLVLPVLKEDVGNFERFLQMYKRVSLQTGENVVLLTVFINIRVSQFEGDDKDDPFLESKNIIARYKHSYMWAQLPWLQVGVKQASPSLIMDIVSMKLPSNALIFTVSLSVDFTINFLNRCRVNVVNGMQVFLPIPFAEYDPKLVYKTKQRPTFVNIHRTKGFWDQDTNDIACFSNKDYKDIRMLRNDFLDENQPSRNLHQIFQSSNLILFRAIDSELRRRFAPLHCNRTNATTYAACMVDAGRRTGSRAQLAQILFQKERHI